jgi:type IX secretion system PorP/SprF family membrane protein
LFILTTGTLKNFYLTIFLWILSLQAMAQDPHYSQYYSAPLYINPAFAGTSQGHRVVVNYRNQWPQIPNAFQTYSVSYDFNLRDLKSGFGVIATSDKAGSAGLRSSTAGFIYSYKIQLHEKWILTPGIQFTYGIRDIDFSKLVFGDQLTFNGPTQDAASNKLDNVTYFDFSTGLLLYNKKFWLGMSIGHLNEPNTSLLGESNMLPRKSSIHTGIKIPLYHGPFKNVNVSSISPGLIYQRQGNYDQLDIGLNYHTEPIIFGVWYRGIPLQQEQPDHMNQDAFAVILGLKLEKMEIGYSYDLTVSNLGGNSGGAHEVSLIMLIDNHNMKKNKPDKFIPCPSFYHQEKR